MIKLTIAIGFLSVFGLVGFALVAKILKGDNNAKTKKEEKNEQNN
jgi:hypothetical protein